MSEQKKTLKENLHEIFDGCLTIPNLLSVIRIALIPVFAVLYYKGYIWWSLIVLALSGLSDLFDGKIARKYNLITNFGKFMDPIADKFMVIGIMLTMLFRMVNAEYYGNVTYERPLMIVFFIAVVLLIFRELAITSFRLVLVNTNGTVVAANMLGKTKTCAQVGCIGALFVEPLLSIDVGPEEKGFCMFC